MQSTPPEGEDRVACANHPYLGAAFTCERCGVFGCESCRSDSLPAVCQPCSLRFSSLVQDLSLEGISLGALLRDSFRLWSRNRTGIALLFGVLVLGRLALELLWSFLFGEELETLYKGLQLGLMTFAVSVFMCWTAELLHQRPERSVSRALRAGLRGFLPLGVSYMLLILGMSFVPVGLLWGLGGLALAVCASLVPGAIVVGGYGLWASFWHSLRLSRRYFRQMVGMSGFAVGLFFTTLYFWVKQLEPALWDVAPMPWLLVVVLRSGMDALVQSLLHGSVVLTWLRLSAHADESVPSSR